jgi:hypothetical protein
LHTHDGSVLTEEDSKPFVRTENTSAAIGRRAGRIRMKWVAHSCYSGGCCWLYDDDVGEFIYYLSTSSSELIFVSGVVGCVAFASVRLGKT